MKNTKHLIFTALCMALGVVLPMAFHMIPNAGSVMLRCTSRFCCAAWSAVRFSA